MPTASRDVVATMQMLFFLLSSSGLFMTIGLVWSTGGYSDNVVTGSNKQTFTHHLYRLRGPIESLLFLPVCISHLV